MKLSQANFKAAFALAAVAGMSGLTDAGAATNTSTASAPSMIDNFVLMFRTDLRGPSLTDPLQSKQPGDTVQKSDTNIETKNYLTLGYKIDERRRLDAVAYWRWQPVANHKFTLRDPYLRLRDTSIAKFGDVNLYADVRLYAPAYENSRSQDMLMGIGGQQVLSYTVPNTRLTAGLTFFEQYNLFTNKSVAAANQGYHLELYTSPSVEYRINPVLAATAFYELGGLHYVGRPFGMEGTYSAVQVGMSWDPSPRVNLSPYLEFKTHGDVNLDTTQIGAALNLNIL